MIIADSKDYVLSTWPDRKHIVFGVGMAKGKDWGAGRTREGEDGGKLVINRMVQVAGCKMGADGFVVG